MDVYENEIYEIDHIMQTPLGTRYLFSHPKNGANTWLWSSDMLVLCEYKEPKETEVFDLLA